MDKLTNDQQEALKAIEKINNELYVKWIKKDYSIMPQLSITISKNILFIALSIPSEFSLNLPEIYHR